MIRELIAANTLLRDKLENMSLQFEQQAKETFLLMKENQELRDRWDMPRSTLVPANQKESEFSCAIYEKIFRKDRGGGQTPKQ